MTDIDKLDEAIIKLVGPSWYSLTSYQRGQNVAGRLHLDWNALAAARAKLEERVPNSFERVATSTPRWCVHFTDGSAREDFEFGDLASEALALAECIYAVVKDD